ncbi:HlyD family efflux transporter periplasmic adaptor subunit [Lachnospiraceae bacterium 42-17]|nr:hypothetical protein [Dorea sp.]
MAKNRGTGVTVYRKKWNINIGVVIFGVVFIYLAVTVLLYLTGNHISAYEVREGSILRDNAYTGFIVRNETVISAEGDGYVNYFAPEGSKVGAKTAVYSLSDEKLDFTEVQPEEEELSTDERDAVFVKTQDFTENFYPEQFNDVYTLKSSIGSILEKKSNQSRQEQLNAMLSEGALGLNVFQADTPGIVIYGTDGYEEITISDVTKDMIEKQNYDPFEFQNNASVKAGDPVYKVITEDTWTVAIVLDEAAAQELINMDSIRVQFSKDHETSVADLAVYNTAKGDLAFLTFDSSMVRYAKERYLDIELIIEDESGLKIPKSAVVEKDFYVVPDSYLSQGGKSREQGVLIDGKGENTEFKKAEIYYRDNENNMVYLDPDAFEEGTVLQKPDSADTYQLKEKNALKGVYNINKGYAVFREVKILCESEEYYIVESGNDYGLANYDHIALIGADVRENDVVF